MQFGNNTMKTIVAFHIGRGGRFNNGGHKTFMPYISHLSQCFNDKCIIISEDEDGNELPGEEWELIDGGSNVILRGCDAISNEVGILDWDTIYDTDIVKYLEDCDEDEMNILYQHYLDDGYFSSEEVRDAAVASQGLRRIDNIKFYRTNAKIFTTDGCVSFFWDGEEDVTEDEAREWMEEQHIDPISIDRWANSFESHFFNN